MSGKVKQQESSGHAPSVLKKPYKDTPRKLQEELVKLQRCLMR